MPATKASPIGNDTPRGRALLALAALATLAALLPGRAGEAAEPCEPSVGRIVSLQGLVEVQPAGAADWARAGLDDRLCIGDTIRAGAYSQAAVALANDSVASLDQLTTMRFVGESESGRSWLDLLFGDVHLFSHRPRALEVDTPIANAFTEGTEFLVRARPERTEVILLDGRVRLASAEGEVLLASGDAGVAVPGEAPRREIVARPRDAVAWALYYPPILAPLAESAPAPSLPAGLQRAVERVAANDYAGALAALDAVPDASRDARYHTYRAGVLLNVGRVDEAAAAIERALARDPEAAEALAERAVIAVVQNREEAALADARRAVELAPDSAPARIALSYALQAAFELEAAREVLREAAARTPDDPLVFARLAEIELSFGDLDAAEAAAARAVALAPGLARTQMVLGFAALTRIEIDQAKAAFERAIELDSALPLARLGLGLARIREGDLEEGRRELEIAAALDPNDSLLRSYLGKAYFEERRGPLDAEQIRIAKQLDPNDPTPWFYDAIRLQTENRPIEALRELETSIALNDNRAPYRSRLLLDEDLAVRQTSLARIYNNLGFEQLGVNEATKSLSLDPANYSAHRFLSDSYLGIPRHEIARASELLQSQLLQPINLNPVQPSLPLTDLNLVAGAGPAEAAFNEFTPLFTRNNTQLTTTGVVGNNNTYGGEGVLSMLYDRTSLSVGGSGFDTDGFRQNNDNTTKLADAYGQVAVTPKLNLQAEYRHRDTDLGDLTLDFDPRDFSPDERRDINQDTARIGGRYAVSPNSDILGSFVYTDRHATFHFVDDVVIDTDEQERGYQPELQYLFRHDQFDIIAGGGLYDVDVDRHDIFDFGPVGCILTDTGCDIKEDFERRQKAVYIYSDIHYPDVVTWTVGVNYTDFEDGQVNFETDKLLKKFGVQWSPNTRLRLRLGAFETLTRALVVDQTIEPTQIAGFNQFFDDIPGTKASRYGVGLDTRLGDSLYGGLELSRRDLDVPIPAGDPAAIVDEDQQENLYRAYLYWTPLSTLAVSGELQYDKFERNDAVNEVGRPDKVETISVPLSISYFSKAGWFSSIGGTYLHQSVGRPNLTGVTASSGNSDSFILDAGVGYRLPKRRGIISFEVNNVLDENFSFQDENIQLAEPQKPRFIPERTFLLRLTLSL